MIGLFVGAWQYRWFVASSIAADLRMRFVRSRLGALWMILNPLAQVAIFAFVLSAVLSARLPGIDNRFAYALYLMAGMLAWSLFDEIVRRSLTVFSDNAPLLTKIVFPRICLPLIVGGSALLNNLLLLAATLVGFIALGHPPTSTWLWLPLLMAINVALAIGLGLVLGVLNVFMRDVGQVVPVALQLLFWFTPIVYVPSIVPEPYRDWLLANPLAALVHAYQQTMVFGESPSPIALVTIAFVALALGVLALFMFRRANAELVDAL
jgi:lipopolysaccharide transport system permease protein